MTRARSDIGPYAIIPAWVADALSGQAPALMLYHRLALMADRDTGVAWPSRATLAGHIGCSADSIDRYVKALQDIGALVVEARRKDDGSPTTNLYTVRFTPPGVAALVRLPSRTDAARGSRTDAAQNQNHLEPPLSEGPQADTSRGRVALTGRAQAEAVGCPRCLASAGSACQGARGLRESCHTERHAVAILAGAPILSGDTPARISSLATALVEGERPDDFAAWYAAYPRKSARADAIKAWRQVLAQLPESVETLIAATAALARRTQAEHPVAQEWARYMPYPATWLRGLRWQDEVTEQAAPRIPTSCVVCGGNPSVQCSGPLLRIDFDQEVECPWHRP